MTIYSVQRTKYVAWLSGVLLAVILFIVVILS
jgi:hypothetical protein